VSVPHPNLSVESYIAGRGGSSVVDLVNHTGYPVVADLFIDKGVAHTKGDPDMVSDTKVRCVDG